MPSGILQGSPGASLAALHKPIAGRILLAMLAAGCGLAAFPAAGQTPGTACSIAALRGPAVILRNGASIRATDRTGLHSDDQIVAGPRARVKITCVTGLEMTVGADTSISIRAIEEAGAADRSLVDLIGGIIRIGLAPHFVRDRLELRTPTAVAAARSTAWVTEASHSNTAVFVIAGEVNVSGRSGDKTVIVPAGFGTDIAAGAAPTAPLRWGQSRAEQALQRTAAP